MFFLFSLKYNQVYLKAAPIFRPNPQSFNRYSYCLNNSLKYVDPSGHQNEYMILYNYVMEHGTGGPLPQYIANIIAQGTSGRPTQTGPTPPTPTLTPPSPSLPDFQYSSSDSSAANGQPSLPINKNETPATLPKIPSTTPDTGNKINANVGEVILNTFTGCAQIIGGIFIIGSGLAVALAGIVETGGLATIISIAVGGFIISEGYQFVAAGIERITYDTIRLPDIPLIPNPFP